METLHLAVAGATGRTGQAVVRQATADPSLDIVAALATADDPWVGQDAGVAVGVAPLGVLLATTIAVDGRPDVLIDFTLPAGCAAWATWCAEHAVPLVSGTTGLNDAQQATLQIAAERVPVVWAPNMSVGVNLMREVVSDIARRLGSEWDVEICETHHRHKIDAPSGTARALLDDVCTARGESAERAAIHGRRGEPGPRPTGQVGVHALRMGEIVGAHEVHFAADAEMLTIRHRAFSRAAFAAGALRAARWVVGRSPGLFGMRDVLRG